MWRVCVWQLCCLHIWSAISYPLWHKIHSPALHLLYITTMAVRCNSPVLPRHYSSYFTKYWASLYDTIVPCIIKTQNANFMRTMNALTSISYKWFHSLSLCLYRSAVSVRLLLVICWVSDLYANCYTKAIFFIDSTISWAVLLWSVLRCQMVHAIHIRCPTWLCRKHHLRLKLSTEYICSCSVSNFHSKLVWFVSVDFVTMMSFSSKMLT